MDINGIRKQLNDNGGPAFPTDGACLSDSLLSWHFQGMTIRDYFATHAMLGEWAYQQADAMLKARAA